MIKREISTRWGKLLEVLEKKDQFGLGYKPILQEDPQTTQKISHTL